MYLGQSTSWISRRFALWGIVMSINAFRTKQKFFSSAVFTLQMGLKDVGVIEYKGPNTPGISAVSANSTYPQSALEKPGTLAASEVGPSFASLTARQSIESAVDPVAVDTPSNRSVSAPRGEVDFNYHWSEVKVDINDFFIAGIVGILQGGRKDANAKVVSFETHVHTTGANILVAVPEKPSDPPFYNRDVINGLTSIVFEAIKGNKYVEVAVEVGWKTDRGVIPMGLICIYNRGGNGVPVPEKCLPPTSPTMGANP